MANCKYCGNPLILSGGKCVYCGASEMLPKRNNMQQVINGTKQFVDFSKYNCDLFDEAHKNEVQRIQFPKDMEKSFELGKRLAEMEA